MSRAATLDVEPAQLPIGRFEHLQALNDDTGRHPHTVHAIPVHRFGSCRDDDAGLLLMGWHLIHHDAPHAVALFNPSLVPHADQDDLAAGDNRLRAAPPDPVPVRG